MKTSLRLFSFVVLCVLASQLGVAQGVATGDLHVTVKDPKGSVVNNAKVMARDAAKGLERTGIGDGQNGYSVHLLPPGTYTVSVEATGFARTQATNVGITVGGLVELPITLTVAGGKEVVEVSAQAELVETSRSSTTDTIGERRIDNLPINGRNYINFTLTDSRIVRDNAPNTGAAPTSGLNMSGQRARSNLVNVDGADATDNSINGVRSTVSQEAVQEFQIITNNYAAEYGRASGGVVNIITRSGTNDFHGDVYGYLRNRNFQAVNPFSTVSNPAYTRVQSGFALGGPIKKDKTYYFFSYETTRRHETGFSSVGQANPGLCVAPSTGSGSFGLCNLDVSTAFGYPQGSGLDILATPQQVAFLGPTPPPLPDLQAYILEVGAASGIAVNGSYPSWFAGLVGPPPAPLPIPSNGSDPLKQFFSSCFWSLTASNSICNGLPSSFLGLTTQPASSGNFPVFEGTSLYSLRLDHNLSSSNRITLRANVSPSTVTGIEVNGQDQPFGQNSYSRTSQQQYRDATGVFQDTWTIGNNKVNEFRFQYARRGLAYFYNKAISDGNDPAVNIIGFAYIGHEPYSFIRRTEKRYQVTDNFSWTIGRHNTKFGGDFNYLPITATFTVNYGGVYFFSNIAGNGLPDFSSVQAYGLGVPQYVVQGIGSPNDSFRNIPIGAFWQDSWRVRSNLTVNYGVRYDVEIPPSFAPPTGLALAGYNSLGVQKGIQTDRNNVQPRIGIAWDPKGDGKSVFRASYGIFYDHPLLGLYFLGDASDGSKTGQLLLFGSNPCDGTSPSPLNITATNVFQGILGASGCLPPGMADFLGYQNPSAATSACGAVPNPQRFDPCFPNSPFLNQNYLTGPNPFPLVSQLFGYPQAKNFVYAYSQQANFTVERDLGRGFALSLAYNFNGGRHLNRPINANTVRGDLLTANWQRAMSDPTSYALQGGPLGVGAGPIAQGFLPCSQNPSNPWVSSALVSFFRPFGLNPSLAGAFVGTPLQGCILEALSILQASGLSTACNPLASGLTDCIPFSDMDANYSNGSSVYHGLSANLRKRYGNHYEFLASYTWSHAIDDSTDLQSTLAPQDSYFPGHDRSNSTFDQRHRFVFSGVYQTGRLSGKGFVSKLFSDWTFAPIVELSSGRPFNIVTGSGDNFQFSSTTGRPNVVAAGTPTNNCGYGTVASKFSPTGFFQQPCFADLTPQQLAQPYPLALLLLDGNLGRNTGVSPWTAFGDIRVSKKIRFSERFNMDLIADMFNVANKMNVAAVSPLFTNAGQATAAYDPRQFQFALRLNW